MGRETRSGGRSLIRCDSRNGTQLEVSWRQASTHMNICRATFLSAVLACTAPGVATAADDPALAQAPQAPAAALPEPDTWITTKVEAHLITSPDIPAHDISVTTTDGVVTLSGFVDTQAQLDRSIAVVKAV